MTYAIGMNVNETYTAAQLANEGKGFAIGDTVTDNVGNEFVFVVAGAAIDANAAVQYTSAYSATHLTTASSPRGRRVGVPAVAIASGSFGWVQVKGVASVGVSVLTLAAADARLNTTATAGSLDDDGTGGAKQIEGIYLSAARGSGTGPAPCTLLYPFVSVTI
jgi:hypothetical protein